MTGRSAATKRVSTTVTGADLRRMLTMATAWLEANAEAVNALNVFPVPDGDTGTNMLLTLKTSCAEVAACSDPGIGDVARAMARGALMGARGNSGVIMSQIFRGLATSLEGKGEATGADLAKALEQGAEKAYHALSQPVEGTILTVVRDAAAGARGALAGRAPQPVGVLEASVAAAELSVERTPSLLPVLKKAGVVDAGGKGLAFVLQGMVYGLKGKPLPATTAASRMPLAFDPSLFHGENDGYGYCTEFFISGLGLKEQAIRKKMERLGKSTVVVSDGDLVKVHLHTRDPGTALSYATALGSVTRIKIDNIDQQHQRLMEAKEQQEAVPLAVVAVAPGPGIAEVFRSIGAHGIVSGGQTMNPSVQDLLRAVEAAPSQRVAVLPNNKNVVLAAQQVAPLTKKRVDVLLTAGVPQGIAALLAFNPEASPEQNVQGMREAYAGVRTIEVTTAARPSRLGDTTVAQGDAIALLDDVMVASGKTHLDALMECLAHLKAKPEVVTLYSGEGVSEGDARAAADAVRQATGAEVEVVAGGQPHYPFIVSVE